MEAQHLIDKVLELDARERRAASQGPLSDEQLLSLLTGRRGCSVSEWDAMGTSSVWAALVPTIQAVAMLPVQVYRRDPKNPRKRERLYDHPVEQRFNIDWNPITPAYDGRVVYGANLMFRGLGAAQKVRDNRLQLREFWNVPAHAITMERPVNNLRSIIFRFHNEDGTPAVRSHEDMFWTNGFHIDGMRGLNPIEVHERTIASSLALEEYFRQFFNSGGSQRLALKFPQRLDDKVVDNLRRRWREIYSNDPFGIGILENGVDAKEIGVSPDKAQMTEARVSQVQANARAFNTPPARMHEHSNSTLKNVEQQSIEFCTYTLGNIIKAIESAARLHCFTAAERAQGYYIKHSIDALLRGDIQTRYQAYGAAIKDGWRNRNEIRELEDLDPEDGLDEFLYPLNMSPTDAQPPTTP